MLPSILGYEDTKNIMSNFKRRFHDFVVMHPRGRIMLHTSANLSACVFLRGGQGLLDIFSSTFIQNSTTNKRNAKL